MVQEEMSNRVNTPSRLWLVKARCSTADCIRYIEGRGLTQSAAIDWMREHRWSYVVVGEGYVARCPEHRRRRREVITS